MIAQTVDLLERVSAQISITAAPSTIKNAAAAVAAAQFLIGFY